MFADSGVHGLNTTGEALQTFSLHLLKTLERRHTQPTYAGVGEHGAPLLGVGALWVSPDSPGEKSGLSHAQRRCGHRAVSSFAFTNTRQGQHGDVGRP